MGCRFACAVPDHLSIRAALHFLDQHIALKHGGQNLSDPKAVHHDVVDCSKNEVTVESELEKTISTMAPPMQAIPVAD